MSTWIYIAHLLNFGIASAAMYAAWRSRQDSVNEANVAVMATRALAGDIDDMDARFDDVHATLERHEKTFAKSRKSRKGEKATTAPKLPVTVSVGSYINPELS